MRFTSTDETALHPETLAKFEANTIRDVTTNRSNLDRQTDRQIYRQTDI